MPSKRNPRGFTLVEVMVALVVGGLVLVLVHQLYAVTIGMGRTLRDRNRAVLTRAVAERWLRSAILSTETGEAAGSFEGSPEKLTFTTWVQVAGGWTERTRVTLAVEAGHLHASGPGVELTFPDSLTHIAFDYLLTPGLQSRWVRTWVSPVSAPLAVRLRVERVVLPCRSAVSGTAAHPCLEADTTLLLIGGRG